MTALDTIVKIDAALEELALRGVTLESFEVMRARITECERTIVSLVGLFDPYGDGRLIEPESECKDRLARARDVLGA